MKDAAEMTQDHSDAEMHAVYTIDESCLEHSSVVLQAAMQGFSIALGRAGKTFVCVMHMPRSREKMDQ